MAPRNRCKKLGLTIPTDPRLKGFDGGGSSTVIASSSSPSQPISPSSTSSHYPPRLLSPSTLNYYNHHHHHYNHRPPSPLSAPPPPPPPPPPPYRHVPSSSETEELQRLVHAPPFWNSKRKLSKQLSMCETARDKAWERRRRQILSQEQQRRRMRRRSVTDADELTDEDLNELKGCIELGFGFNEEDGQQLCSTLPALDLYFAVNRQLSPSPVSTPHSTSREGSFAGRSDSLDSPKSDDAWKICGPGDDPQQVKTKLRHWAQAVACSVLQSFNE